MIRPTTELVPLGSICNLNPKLPKESRPSDTDLVSFVPMAAVDEKSASIAAGEIRTYSTVKKGFTPFLENDVLFAKITPCMENGKVALAKGLHGGIGFGSTEFHVLRASDRVVPEWLRYFVLRPSFRSQAKRRMSGAVGQQRVPEAFLSESLIPIPSVDEQRRLVDILSRAENIVRMRYEAAQKAKLITPALFLDMFGDPATNPKKWVVKSVGDITAYTRYGPRFPDRKYADTGARILRTTDMDAEGAVRWKEAPVLPVSQGEAARFALRVGTIVITRTGATIGKVALFRGAEEPCIAGAYLIELGTTSEVDPDYALGLFLSDYGQGRLTAGSRAVAQPNLNAPSIRAIPIPIPQKKLQQSFAEHAARVRALAAQQEAAAMIADLSFQSLLAKEFGA